MNFVLTTIILGAAWMIYRDYHKRGSEFMTRQFDKYRDYKGKDKHKKWDLEEKENEYKLLKDMRNKFFMVLMLGTFFYGISVLEFILHDVLKIHGI